MPKFCQFFFEKKQANILNSFLDHNRYFLRHPFNKKIDTKYQSIISDQKKRSAFAKNELNKIVLKGLLTVNNYSPLDISAVNKIKIHQKRYLGSNRKKNLFKCVTVGPVLFLEETINPIFTKKSQSFSRIRNRCLLTGKSTIIGKYRLSRITFRYTALHGFIPGLTKNK